MFRLVIFLVVTLLTSTAWSCPTLALGQHFQAQASLSFSFTGPEGYVLRVSEVPDTLVSAQLQPEGASSMDNATGRVRAPTLNMTLALRAIPADQLENFQRMDQNKIDKGAAYVELPDGLRAVREDISPYDIRHYLFPVIDGSARELEVVLMVPQSIRECVESYEDDARAIIRSLQF